MSRSFGQYCGLAKALEMVGERWALLVVRDLVLGPKRFTELRDGLPRVPASILAARLNELERAGVVRRRVLPHLDAALVYELTEYGAELEDVVLRLGLWGARSLGDPARDDLFTLDAAVLALHASFRPERARGVRASYGIALGPAMVLHALVDDGELRVTEGERADADLHVEVRGPVGALLSGRTSPAEAVRTGLVGLRGPGELLDLFVDLFHIPAAPRPPAGIAVR